MTVKVKDIERGMLFGGDRLWYKSLSPAFGGPDSADELISVEVQWADGGIGYRHWDASDGEIELPLWEGYVPEFLRG